MRDRDRDIEIIEVLPVDDPPPAWSDATEVANSQSAGPLRSRRTTVIAAAGVLALVAAAVSVSGGDPDEASPSTTVEVPTSRLAPTPSENDASFNRYLIDSASLRAYSADIVTQLSDDGIFQLWGNLRPARRWLGVQMVRGNGRSYAFTNSTRRVVDGFELVSSIPEPSITTLVVDVGDRSATIRAEGLTDEQLIRVARGLTVHEDVGTTGGTTIGVIEDGSGVMAELGISGFASGRWAEHLLFGEVKSQMRYLDDNSDMITLRVADGSTENRLAALSYFTRDVVVAGDGRVAGVLRETAEAIVWWVENDHLLSLTGSVNVESLIDLSRSVRGAKDVEWTALLYGLRPDYRIGAFAELATGAATDGTTWRAGVQLAERDNRTKYLWWWTLPEQPDTASSTSASVDLADVSTVDTVVVRGATYVFISAPTSLSLSVTFATVTAADGTSSEVRLDQPFPEAPVSTGAVRMESTGEFIVTLSTRQP